MKYFLIAMLFSLACFNYDVFAEETALDRYIAKPDSSYTYFSYSTDRDVLYDTYFLYMASQSWRSSDEVDRKLWTHVIEITVPKIRHSSSPGTAILLVNGGSNGNYPTKTDDQAAIIAQALGSVVVKVNQIPNQPLYFADGKNIARSEDAIIAYSFDKFLKTGDEEWPALLPMTKSVVRAMDTIQAFLAGKITITDFIVVGGSKRGWATWLTAAVDPRIKAIAPASIDLLNMGEQFRRHFQAYGFYAPAIADYVSFDIPNRIATPEGQALLGIVDPYEYRERFTMPKIILNSTGDQFFLPDSSQFYFEELPETKWLRYLPNSNHKQSLDVAKSLASWIDQINDGETPPRFNWTIEPDGAVRVVTGDRRPDRVRLWQATNPNARDFRLESIGPVWTANDLAPIEPGIYRGYVPPPPQGWTAFMVELTYEESGLLEPNLVFTTDVVITPNTLPFAEPIANAECLFNWAEGSYPDLFAPSGFLTVVEGEYTYRYYSATDTYLGISSADNHVYYMGADRIMHDVGPLSDWLLEAGCQPPPPPPVECLFNWAESNYPDLFAPSGSATAVSGVYTYRYYSSTNAYVGISSTDNHVYYMGADGILKDEGPLSNWLATAGCQ